MVKLTLSILILSIAFVQGFLEHPSKIVGGSNAKLGQYPYQVSLRDKGIHYCGGILVTQRHVVTAAHCIKGIVSAPWTDFTVVTGTVSLKNGGQSHRVSNAVFNPLYTANSTLGYPNDIAVVTLTKPIIENNNKKIIRVATNDPPIGAELRLTGWGRTTINNSGDLPDILQTTTTRLLSNQECQRRIGSTYHIDKGHLCTLKQKGIGACQHDSGGPLVYNNQLVGVVSWIFPCAQGYPDVFTRASQYTDFINKIIATS